MSYDERQALIRLLHDTFWEACRESDDPFGYFDAGMNKIDGELPPGVFGKMADAVMNRPHE